jgi:hypothetical protein
MYFSVPDYCSLPPNTGSLWGPENVDWLQRANVLNGFTADDGRRAGSNICDNTHTLADICATAACTAHAKRTSHRAAVQWMLSRHPQNGPFRIPLHISNRTCVCWHPILIPHARTSMAFPSRICRAFPFHRIDSKNWQKLKFRQIPKSESRHMYRDKD